MTMRVFAVDGKTDTSQDYRLTAGGVWAPASALNARTGVTSVPTLTGTGSLTANISPFTAVIDGTSNSLQGCYCVTNDTAAGITITAGSAQARIDLIGVQVQDNTWDGSGQHQAIPVVVAGTPGSGAAPATPANTIPLFTVAVPASASSVNFSTATTSVFPYTAAVGGIIPVRNNSDKPAVANGVQFRFRLDVPGTAGTNSPLEWSTDGVTYRPVYDASALGNAFVCTSTTRPSSPSTGKVIYETNTGNFMAWDGTAWTMQSTTSPLWTSVGAISSPFSGAVYVNKNNQGVVTFRGLLNFTSLPASTIFTLPAGYAPASNRYANVIANPAGNNIPLVLQVLATGAVSASFGWGSGSSGTMFLEGAGYTI